MSKSESLKRALVNAREYIGKLSKREHYREATFGKVHEITVKTTICHQANPGDQNYWNDADFDKALRDVIASRFKELASHALELMERSYKDAFVAEKAALLEKLAQIEAIEQEDATPIATGATSHD